MRKYLTILGLDESSYNAVNSHYFQETLLVNHSLENLVHTTYTYAIQVLEKVTFSTRHATNWIRTLRFVAVVKSAEPTTVEDNKLCVNCLTGTITPSTCRVAARIQP